VIFQQLNKIWEAWIMKEMSSPAQMSKRKRLLFFIAVMLSNVAVMGDMPLYIITANIYGEFPNSTGVVNYVLSGPPLLLILASLAAPFLLKKISKRNLLITGAVLFTIGSVFGVAINSAGWMALTRTLVGIGQGLVNVCAVALICDVYVDKKVRARYIGFYNGSMNAVGILFGYFSGVIAAGSTWQNVFKLYYASIPMLIMIILFVPNIGSQEPLVEESAESGAAKANQPKRFGFIFWEMIICYFVIAMLCMVIAYFLSVYVEENALGDTTLLGTANSVAQIIAFLGCMVFGPIYQKLRRRTLTLALLLAVITFALWFFVRGSAVLYVILCIETLSYGLLMNYGYMAGPLMAPAGKENMAISLATFAYGFASFVSTYFVTFLMSVLKTDSITDLLGVFFVIAIAIFVFDLISSFVTRKQTSGLLNQ